MTARPLDITLVSGGMAHHGGTLTESSLGGSETAAICVSRALARRGHHVTVFSPCEGGLWDGVQYLPIQMSQGYLKAAPHDVCIVSRLPGLAAQPNGAGLTVLWMHDLATKRRAPELVNSLWNVGAVFVLSAFQQAQYLEIHPAIAPVVVQTRNGIDLDWFAGEAPARDRWRLVYGSRPERGLQQALDIMELSWRRNLPWRLVVAGYDNTAEQMKPMYDALWRRCGEMPNVDLAGPLTQDKWHGLIRSARGLLYPGCPGAFREISGIVFMEAQAAGTPCVAAAKGAVPETLSADAGVLVGSEDADTTQRAYWRDVLDGLDVLADDTRWQAMSDAGRAHAQTLAWDGVAEDWEAVFRHRLDARQADPWRLARACAREGDQEALAIEPTRSVSAA